VLFITSAVALSTAIAIWPRRFTRGVIWLFLLEVAASVWTMGIAFESAATTIALKYFWSKIAYLGTTTVPPFFFLFVYEYSHQRRITSRSKIPLFFIIPTIVNLLAIINESHHLIWTDLIINPITNLGIYGHGILFWILVIGYSYLMLISGIFLLLKSLYQFNVIYRTQNLLVLFAAIIPFAGNMISLVGLSPIEGLDWGPPAFTISGVLISWSILHFNLFKFVPVARNQIIDRMSDGLLVLDAENWIVDANHAMQTILNMNITALIGKKISDLSPGIPNIHRIPAIEKETSFEIRMTSGPENHYYEIRVTPLEQEVTGYHGKSVLFHDVTKRKLAEIEREKLISELQNAMAEVKTLSGLLPICSHCKKIRDDQGYWQNVEEYVRQHTEAEFSHGICPDCIAKLYPELHARMQKKKNSGKPDKSGE